MIKALCCPEVVLEGAGEAGGGGGGGWRKILGGYMFLWGTEGRTENGNLGESGKFYRDKTKILRVPSPLPHGSPKGEGDPKTSV